MIWSDIKLSIDIDMGWVLFVVVNGVVSGCGSKALAVAGPTDCDYLVG